VSNNAAKNINQRQRARKVDSEEKLKNFILSKLGEPLITVDVTEDQILNSIDEAFAKFSDWIYNGQQQQVFIIETISGVQDYILDDRVQAISGVSFARGLEGTGSGSISGGINGSIAGIGFGSLLPPQYVPYVNAEGQMSSLASNGNFSCFNNYSASGVVGGVAGPHTGQQTDARGIEAAYAAMVNAQSLAAMFGGNISYDFNSQTHILRIFEDISGPIAIEASLYYIPNPEYDSAYGHSFIKEYSCALVKRQWGQNLGKFDSTLIGGSSVNYQRLIDEAQAEIDRLEEDLINRWSEPLGIYSA